MHSGNSLTTLFSLWRFGFLNFVPLALGFRKRFFLFSEKARIGDMFAFTGHSKGIKPTSMPIAEPASVLSGASPMSQEIETNHLPVAVRVIVQDFGRSCKGPVLDNPKTAYFAQSQALLVQSATVGKLRIRDRIIAILTFVSGKTCFLAGLCSLFETTEERFERQINTYRDLL